MAGDFLLLLVGLSLLLGGGETVVRGATSLARAMGVSPLVIGLTVVAFGTSAPELAVNVIAAWRDRPAISFGNIIGSNLANIGLIVGLTAMIRPIVIQGVVIRRELPMMLLATAAAVVMALDGYLRTGAGFYDRSDGLLLLLLFGVFLYYTVGDFVRQRAQNGSSEIGGPSPPPASLRFLVGPMLLTIGGLVALVFGGGLTVEAAERLAHSLGVPDEIIGLTILAVGTSLPELAASVVASLRGHVELAIGNVVGSNIFNLLLVMGITSVVRPVEVPAVGGYDLALLSVLSCMLMGVAVTYARQIVRTEAVLLLLLYLSYIIWRSGFSIPA